MGTAPLPKERAEEAVAAFNRFGTQIAAANFLGIPRSTFQHRLETASRHSIWPAPAPVEPARVMPPAKPRVIDRAGSTGGSTDRVQAIGDAHNSPEISRDRFRRLGKHAADFGADYAVSIGDWDTLDSLNTHISNDSLQGKQKNAFATDLEVAEESLSLYDKGLGSHKLKKHKTMGNHERRAWFYEEANPESQNLLVGPLTCLQDQYGWVWSEYGEYFFLGGVGFVHAPLNKLGKTFGGETRQNVLHKMTFDLVRGHDHNSYVHTSPKFGPQERVKLVGLGCALPYGHVEKYAQHALNGWDWGVYELRISGGRIESEAFVSMQELERRYG